MSGEFDLDAMLADILDVSKPLPTAAPPTITPEPEQPVAPTTVQATDDDPLGLNSLFTNPEQPVVTTPEPQVSIGEAISATLDAAVLQGVSAVGTGVFADSADRAVGYELPPVQIPTFTNDEIASAIDIRNFATLVTLKTNRWHAKVKDRGASRDAASAAGAVDEAFETRKNLLAGVDQKLKRIHKAIDKARAKHYEHTAPWSTSGVQDDERRTGGRVLPNTAFFEYISDMGECTKEMDTAVADFVPDYPNLVQMAQKNLGTRFDPTEYPAASDIARHFGISFDFQPIPQGTDFKGLPAAQCQALADAIEGRKRTMMENAMADLWVRAHEAVGRMAERLSHPDKLFHHTLVENVKTVARQMKHLNVTGDRRVEEIRQYITDHLIDHDVEELRKNPTTRSTVAAHAQSVVEMMAKYGRGEQ